MLNPVMPSPFSVPVRFTGQGLPKELQGLEKLENRLYKGVDIRDDRFTAAAEQSMRQAIRTHRPLVRTLVKNIMKDTMTGLIRQGAIPAGRQNTVGMYAAGMADVVSKRFDIDHFGSMIDKAISGD